MALFWLWLTGRVMTWREKLAVVHYFSDMEECYRADAGVYARIEGLSKKAITSLCDKNTAEAEAVLEACNRQKIRILTYRSARYPAALRNIPDPPLVLYCRGNLPDLNMYPCVGVVGTRKASGYGLRTAQRMGWELASHGALVVSGMADGIDAAATAGALRSGAPVIGVLGCGPEQIYPACNRALFAQMEKQGCLISEYPPGTSPIKWYFPRRNRIISGLSCGVLVVEAPQKSGALITAEQARDQGREVYAVPGNVDNACCLGSNALIMDGAGAVSRGWDILRHYHHRYPGKLRRELPPEPSWEAPAVPAAAGATVKPKKAVDNPQPRPYSDTIPDAQQLEEPLRTIYLAAASGEKLIDTVIAETGLPSGEVLAALTQLEIEGYVTSLPGGRIAPAKKP